MQGPGELQSPRHPEGLGGIRVVECRLPPALCSRAIWGILSSNPQAIQRRLNEIEAALRELENEGMEVELALRMQSSE